MKKIMMTLVAMFATVSMSAQNDMYIGGTANFVGTGSDNTDLTISPEWGMKLDDKLGFGIKLDYTYNEPFGLADSRTRIAVNPYVRYDFLKCGKFKIFVDGGVYFGTSKVKDMDADNNFGIKVVPGISYRLTDQFTVAARANNLFLWDVAAPAHSTCTNTVSLLERFNVNTYQFGFFYNF